MEITPQAVPRAPRNNAPIAARKISTEEFAGRLLVKEQTVRASLCRHGHYLSLKPVKLANRRLLWDADEVDNLIAGKQVAV